MGWIFKMIKSVMLVVIISGLTVVTTGIVVNAYVQSLLTKLNVSWEGQPTGFGGIVQGLMSTNKKSDVVLNKTKTDDDSKSSEREGDVDADQQVPEDSLPVMGGMTGEGQTSQEQTSREGQVVVTPDDVIAKKEGLADKDKEEIFAILMSKLPENEMQHMTDALEDGLTEAEMIEIQQMISKYLDPEEYDKMMKILQ